ncbi:hypothetical protein VNO80_10926 [Phaseolus coccineus]|uniref:Uncharacterized protein n=1 Tax=Phaseolus coccineus TaxID=3886 RepID=A0AAN9NEB6_PHACN
MSGASVFVFEKTKAAVRLRIGMQHLVMAGKGEDVNCLDCGVAQMLNFERTDMKEYYTPEDCDAISATPVNSVIYGIEMTKDG